MITCYTRHKTRRRCLSPFKRKNPLEGLALMVTVKVPWEPELLDPWKAAWDRLIWKAVIPKVKAIEGELNRNLLLYAGRSQTCIHALSEMRSFFCMEQLISHTYSHHEHL